MYWRPNMYNYVTACITEAMYVHPDQARKTLYFSHEFSRRHTNHINDLCKWLLLETARSHKKDIADRCPGGFPGKTVYVTLFMYVRMFYGVATGDARSFHTCSMA